ncbi:isochorismatase family protein [Desulfovibrio sp.]|uniref:isochorismatase family protein n=1 Tax=Desulfovibrio sp. TaxID=885 RepID=UPI0023D079C5|nr:isochorismatase family protein [Desulfovibrio sp.]MDE7240985.1 isochorismatase family protein [Desulfovibrio sp.]
MRPLFLLQMTALLLLSTASPGECAAISLPGVVLSHYALDNGGGTVKNADGALVYKEGAYTQDYAFSPHDTAFVVMDPWINQTPRMDAIVFPIYEKYIIPIIRAAKAAGFTCYIFSEPPENLRTTRDERGLATRDNPEVMELVDEEKVLKRLHWKYSPADFSRDLKAAGIQNLIYLGFASNWCVPFRELGMFAMRKAGFKCFFVPEASAAVEIGDGWEKRELDSAMRKILALQRFPLLNGDTLLERLKMAEKPRNE